MIKSYFKTAFRYLQANKLFTLVNVFGLAVGMAAFILLLQFNAFQLSYDTFNKRSADIYRIGLGIYGERKEHIIDDATNFAFIGEELKEDFPEVEAFCRMRKGSAVISYKDLLLSEDFDEGALYYADPSFFKVFDYELVRGDRASALSHLNSVIISEPVAERFFKGEDPMGKIIKSNAENFTVTGVIRVPKNSHLQFDYLFPLEKFFEQKKDLSTEEGKRKWSGYYTYVLLGPAADVKTFESKLPAFYRQNCYKEECNNKLIVQPLERIHLYSHMQAEASANGDGKTVYFLTVLAFFILVVAWVNYISLSTAGVSKRFKEVGVRLLLGGRKKTLMMQFLCESILINLIAGMIAFAVVSIGWVYLERYVQVTLSFSVLSNAYFWLVVALILLAGAILSGLYPAYVLSSFEPVAMLKGTIKNVRGVSFRKVLTSVQFVFSIFLLLGTIIVSQQVRFMRSRDLGFSLNNVLVIKVPGDIQKDFNNHAVLKNKLLTIASVDGVSGSTLVPGKHFNLSEGNVKKVNAEGDGVSCKLVFIDSDFPKVYSMDVKQGKEFFNTFFTAPAYVLNAAAAKLFGIEDVRAVNQSLDVWGNKLNVAGIIENHYQNTVKVTPEPIVYICVPPRHSSIFYVSVKLNNAPTEMTVRAVEAAWKEVFPQVPFEFFFADDVYNEQYKDDLQLNKLFNIFASLSIVIFAFGLFSLSLFTALQRTKEVGIRKVHGASSFQIVMLFLKNITMLVLLSCCIAWPFTYFLADSWLANFSQRVPIAWWWFLLSGLIVLIISYIGAGYYLVRAAMASPVKSLKYN